MIVQHMAKLLLYPHLILIQFEYRIKHFNANIGITFIVDIHITQEKGSAAKTIYVW